MKHTCDQCGKRPAITLQQNGHHVTAPLMALCLEEYPECRALVDVERGALRFPAE